MAARRGGRSTTLSTLPGLSSFPSISGSRIIGAPSSRTESVLRLGVRGEEREEERSSAGEGGGGGRGREGREGIRSQEDIQSLLASYEEVLSKLPEAYPYAISATLWSHEDLTDLEPRVQVKVPELEVEGGINDPRLGTFDRTKKCGTCKQTIQNCSGHIGYVLLNEPMINPLHKYAKWVAYILQSVCHNCGKLLLSKESLEKDGIITSYRIRNGRKIVVRRGKTGINLAQAIAKASVGKHCRRTPEEYEDRLAGVCSPGTKLNIQQCAVNPEIIIPKGTKNVTIKYTPRDGGEARIFPIRDIFEILNMISDGEPNFRKEDNDTAILGFNGTHPRDLILRSLPIISPCMRPPAVVNGITNNHAFTEIYISIVSLNNAVGAADIKLTDTSLSDPDKGKTQRERDDAIVKLRKKVSDLMIASQSKNTGHEHVVSISEEFKGKKGIFRESAMGHRVNHSARTVIDANPTLKYGEIGIPRYIAEELTFPVKVTLNNINELKILIRIGQANIIIFGTGHGHLKGRRYKIIEGKREVMASHLKIGDTVRRYMRNGDIVVANRQPTLHKEGMLGFRVVIVDQLSIGLHPLVTTPFNADFDGDEMNIHFPQTIEAMIEVMAFTDARKCLISAQTNKPTVGYIMDLVTGSYLLTDKKTMVNRNVFEECIDSMTTRDQLATLNERLDERGILRLSGRALFSALLPEDFYYEKGDVLIQNGVLIKGRLDKKHVGAAHKSILQALHNDYGKERAADFLTDSMYLITRWMHDYPITVGIEDCAPPDPELRKKFDKDIHAVQLLVEAMGEPPADPVALRQYEKTVMTMVNIAESMGKLATERLEGKNYMLAMTDSGGKGDVINVAKIGVCLGQQCVRGERPKNSLPWFDRADLNPVARGFVPRSYSEGLDPASFIWNAMAGREGLLDTATKTADVGYARNKMAKIMESVKISPDGSVRNENENIIQFVAGCTGFNPEYLEWSPNGSEIASFIDLGRIIGQINASAGFYGSPYL